MNRWEVLRGITFWMSFTAFFFFWSMASVTDAAPVDPMEKRRPLEPLLHVSHMEGKWLSEWQGGCSLSARRGNLHIKPDQGSWVQGPLDWHLSKDALLTEGEKFSEVEMLQFSGQYPFLQHMLRDMIATRLEQLEPHKYPRANASTPASSLRTEPVALYICTADSGSMEHAPRPDFPKWTQTSTHVLSGLIVPGTATHEPDSPAAKRWREEGDERCRQATSFDFSATVLTDTAMEEKVHFVRLKVRPPAWLMPAEATQPLEDQAGKAKSFCYLLPDVATVITNSSSRHPSLQGDGEGEALEEDHFQEQRRKIVAKKKRKEGPTMRFLSPNFGWSAYPRSQLDQEALRAGYDVLYLRREETPVRTSWETALMPLVFSGMFMLQQVIGGYQKGNRKIQQQRVAASSKKK